MSKSLAPCEYKTGKALGSGSYATVREAVKISTGEKFAVKVISKKLMSGREHMILNEIEVLKRLSKGHSSIVTLWDYFETPNNLYLVMDLCIGGELFDRLCDEGAFYEDESSRIVHTILSAVSYLHDQNIVHRDIKPENLIYKSKGAACDELLIADFGLSKIMSSEEFDILMTTCGTPGYMAPEVITKKGHGKPVDIWSIGVLTYFIICGYTPFDTQHGGAEELNKILSGKFSFEPIEYWKDISDLCKDFISKCIVVDPTGRMTAKQALQHPWIREYQTKKLDNTARVKNPKQTFRKAVEAVRFLNKLGSSAKNSLGSKEKLAMDLKESYKPVEEKLDDMMVIVRD